MADTEFTPEEIEAYFGKAMAWAGDEYKVGQFLGTGQGAGSKWEKMRRKAWGIGAWDAEAGAYKTKSPATGAVGVFAGGGPWNRPYTGMYPHRDAPKHPELSSAQMAQIRSAVQTTMANIASSQDAAKKSELLLGKIQAKSDMVQQLIDTRRQKREQELAQTRGLY